MTKPYGKWYNKYVATPLQIKERSEDGRLEIAIIAHDLKKELMAQFCIAYCGTLSKHNLCATAVTASYISEATGVHIDRLMSGEYGGEEQVASRIAYNEIDILLYFRDTRPTAVVKPAEMELLRACDQFNIPVATNIATAETIITALERGDLDWRNFVNPHSEYNQKKK